MPFPVQLLTTFAECDLAKDIISLELREFKVNGEVVDLRDDKKTASATARANELSGLAKSIPALTTLIAGLEAGSTIRFQNEQLLRQASRRQENLTTEAPNAVPKGVAAVVLALDVRQVEVQVPEIELCLAEIAAHRDTLTA